MVEAGPVERGGEGSPSTAPPAPDAGARAKLEAVTAALARDGPTRGAGLIALGMSHQHLADLASRGVLRRLRHGVYDLPG